MGHKVVPGKARFRTHLFFQNSAADLTVWHLVHSLWLTLTPARCCVAAGGGGGGPCVGSCSCSAPVGSCCAACSAACCSRAKASWRPPPLQVHKQNVEVQVQEVTFMRISCRLLCYEATILECCR